ncbi:MAG: hypothetical protein PWQ91_1431 [Eubacteriales bacterium]|nr:hypothetical protein [Eubacteriales bacterium]
MREEGPSFRVRLQPQDMVYLDYIFEGYEGLGLVTIVPGRRRGEAIIHVTPETAGEVEKILLSIPRPLKIVYRPGP